MMEKCDFGKGALQDRCEAQFDYTSIGLSQALSISDGQIINKSLMKSIIVTL
jgi:hypothetical protein